MTNFKINNGRWQTISDKSDSFSEKMTSDIHATYILIRQYGLPSVGAVSFRSVKRFDVWTPTSL